ncbi:MAG TPA: nickel pincer cofactor biosynthesis protein LarC [Jatrophihabitans sp.]|nr:nickel pincer cofactor biosynthesis protein LarC [Jatrophihabitans sp.]
MSKVGWVDASCGVSGDMLLGACLDAGAPLAAIQSALDGLGLPERITVEAEAVRRGGLAATRAVVRVPQSRENRTLDDVLAIVGADSRAAQVFRVLAAAEGRVHGVPVDEVHFHEVGALDSIADVVGVIAALNTLCVERLVSSPIALGGGRAQTEHGPIPVPGPAVVELLRARNAPAFGGPLDTELATPTGVALLTVLADQFAPLPGLRADAVGVGAGSKDPAGHPNVTRLVIGTASPLPAAEPAVVIEANVDDLDPRLWPEVLTQLLDAGASDAWLVPITMKKGRPAHTLSVLAEPQHVETLERLVLTQTSTIGLRRYAVDKLALPRESVAVAVDGDQVRIKIARLDGRVVNAVPEYDDVARIAAERGVPVKIVMDAARAAAERHLTL